MVCHLDTIFVIGQDFHILQEIAQISPGYAPLPSCHLWATPRTALATRVNTATPPCCSGIHYLYDIAPFDTKLCLNHPKRTFTIGTAFFGIFPFFVNRKDIWIFANFVSVCRTTPGCVGGDQLGSYYGSPGDQGAPWVTQWSLTTFIKPHKSSQQSEMRALSPILSQNPTSGVRTRKI